MYNKEEKPKLLFISSCGGHLSELLELSSLFDKYEYLIVTERVKTNKSLEKKYNTKYLVYGTKKNIFTYFLKFIFNFFKSLNIYLKFKPDYIITTGAHTAVSMSYIGRILGSKIIYIETMANINTKTITGKLIYPIAHLFIVQWESMLEIYPKAKYFGVIK